LVVIWIRLEKVNIKSLGGQSKVAGTIVCVCGAMVMTLYKGPALKVLSADVKSHQITSNSKPNFLLGAILVFGSVVVCSACIAFQVIFIINSNIANSTYYYNNILLILFDN
jgi:hypothetical protein